MFNIFPVINVKTIFRLAVIVAVILRINPVKQNIAFKHLKCYSGSSDATKMLCKVVMRMRESRKFCQRESNSTLMLVFFFFCFFL